MMNLRNLQLGSSTHHNIDCGFKLILNQERNAQPPQNTRLEARDQEGIKIG